MGDSQSPRLSYVARSGLLSRIGALLASSNFPSWAGAPYELSLGAGPKAKAKAKAKSGKNKSEKQGGDEEGEPKKRRKGGKVQDPELDKIMLSRSSLLTSKRWQGAVLAINDDVEACFRSCEAYEGSKELFGNQATLSVAPVPVLSL